MNVTTAPSRWYYDPIVIIAAGCIVAVVSFGARATMGLFTYPISEAHQWHREVYGFAMALQNLMWGIFQPIAGGFADKYGTKCNRKLVGISPDARACLTAYDWPGNVRELENAIERAIVLGTTDVILPEDLPEALLERETSAAQSTMGYHEAVTQTKKQIIVKAIDEAKGNYTEAARRLGVHPNYLHRLIRNLNLRAQLKSST